jgi:Carboxypeptidase regulatory-like domain
VSRLFLPVQLAAALVVALVPAAAFAQASIAGVVRDASGAALPGVTVEASSPALIERTRTSVSDGTGQYAIVDLRPGVFTVTFTLPGFVTVRRTGVELTGSFVATVNAELAVRGLAETVRVKAGIPSIDVQSTRQQASMTSEIVSSVPTGRSLVNLGVLIPGMTTVSARTQNDVGGTNNLQNMFMAIHGGRVTDQRTYVDGVTIRNLQSEGHATNFTPDMSSTEVVAIDYAATTAEEPLGGVRASYIPRDGGNTFRASVFATGATGAFQETNLTMELERRGLTQPDSLKVTYDVNPTGGGPIVRDKAWFYGAARFQSNQAYVGGIFENRNAGDAAKWSYDPDLMRPGLFAISQQSGNGRVTWQPAPRHKLSAFVEKQWRRWDEGNVTRAPEAFSRFRFAKNQLAIGTWSSPLTDRVLVEVRGAYHAEEWMNIGADDMLPNNRSLIPVLEQGGAYPGLMYRAKNGVYAGQSTPFIAIGHASASYVTGAHGIKGGIDLLGGTNTNANTFNDSGLQYRFNDGVPNQITQFATPYTMAWRTTEIGLFVQDRWTLKRVTLNTGLRFDSFGTSFPPQHLGPATLAPSRDVTLPETSWYGLKDLSPRFGAAFDVTGDGRTVVKGTAGRYVVALSPAAGNPIANMPLSATRAWTDDDLDYVADCALLNPFDNGECGTLSDVAFGGTTPSLAYDPSVLRGWNVRPYDWEFSAAIERELRPRVTAGVAYYRRVYGNFTVQDNRATTAADYAPFSVTAPIDARLPGGGGYVVGGLFDLNPGKRGLVDNYVSAAARYGRQIEHWNGIDAGVSVRLARALVQGGISSGRTSVDFCDIAARIPEVLGTPAGLFGRATPWSLDQCHMDTRILTQAKAMGTYRITPIGVEAAATFQSTPGPEIQANYLAGDAVVEPSLGRPLSGGANTTVTLLAPGRVFGDRVNQLDLRIAKVVRARGVRTVLNFDIYNALNANPVTVMNLNYTGTGERWLQPQGILPARLFKLSVQFDY